MKQRAGPLDFTSTQPPHDQSTYKYHMLRLTQPIRPATTDSVPTVCFRSPLPPPPNLKKNRQESAGAVSPYSTLLFSSPPSSLECKKLVKFGWSYRAAPETSEWRARKQTGESMPSPPHRVHHGEDHATASVCAPSTSSMQSL